MPNRTTTPTRALALLLLGALLALTGQPAQAAEKTILSTTFDTDTAAFTTYDRTPVGPYADTFWTLKPSESGGRYDPRNMQVSDGRLVMHVAGTGGYAAFDPTRKGTTYLDATWHMNVTGTGRDVGLVWLLWPTNERWADGEFDAIEQPDNLKKRTSSYVYAHRVVTPGGEPCHDDGYCPNTYKKKTGQSLHGKKTYRVRWEPPTKSHPHGRVRVWINSRKVADVDNADQVPVGPHRLLLQASSTGPKPSSATIYVYDMKIKALS